MREKWIDVDYYEQIIATDAEVLQREETHQIPAIPEIGMDKERRIICFVKQSRNF